MEQKLKGMTIAILVSTNFEQVEMTEPRKALEEQGAKIILISNQPGKVNGMQHDKIADSFQVDMNLSEANPNNFDAVLLPGGAINADHLRMVPEARAFVTKMQEQGKPITAICHAPWLLASAGLAKGRTLTSYYTIQDDMRNAGADWIDTKVIRDKNLVTSRQPSDIPAFNAEIIKLFSEYWQQHHSSHSHMST